MVIPTQSVYVLKIATVVAAVEITDPENTDQPGSVLFIDLLLCIPVRPEVTDRREHCRAAGTLDYPRVTLCPGTGAAEQAYGELMLIYRSGGHGGICHRRAGNESLVW